jgi:hypothetical protein
MALSSGMGMRRTAAIVLPTPGSERRRSKRFAQAILFPDAGEQVCEEGLVVGCKHGDQGFEAGLGIRKAGALKIVFVCASRSATCL